MSANPGSAVRRLSAGGALLLALAACGGSQADVLTQAAQNLGRVRSGSMDLRMAVSGGDGNGQVGFEEKGQFSLPNAGALPVANTEVIQFVGSKQEGSTFISTGRNAYIGTAGAVYQLPDTTVARLRSASTSTGGNLAGLQLDRWAQGATVSDGGQVDGVSTDRVTASVNVAAFLNDVMQLSRGLGLAAAVPQVNKAEAADLARAVKATHYELWAGRDDHLVRRLAVSVDFRAPAGGVGSDALARYSQSHLQLDLDLSSVNHPVTVADPAGAQPYAVYCSKQPESAACSAVQS